MLLYCLICDAGVLPYTGGDALIYGQSISSEGGLDAIRPIMGVCPQFDVLWSELTGQEHLMIFGHIKGVQFSQVGLPLQVESFHRITSRQYLHLILVESQLCWWPCVCMSTHPGDWVYDGGICSCLLSVQLHAQAGHITHILVCHFYF